MPEFPVTPPTAFRDEVPRGPSLSHNQQQQFSAIPETDLAVLQKASETVLQAANRIAMATAELQQVTNQSKVHLTRRDKIVVGVSALGLVGVGIGGTLVVQSIRRGRAGRREMMEAVTAAK